MRHASVALLGLGVLLLLSTAPLPAAAQGRAPTKGRSDTEAPSKARRADPDREAARRSRSDGRYEDRRERRRNWDEDRDEWYDDDDDDRRRARSQWQHRKEWWSPGPYRPAVRRTNREGPPFCRTGRGHPKFGYRWCVEKGFAPPRRSRWTHRSYGRVVVRHAPARVARPRVTFDVRVMVDLLGPRLYSHITAYSRRHGYRGDPVARWVPMGARGWVLQVRQDGRPLAELVDFDGDRRIDDVWLFDR